VAALAAGGSTEEGGTEVRRPDPTHPQSQIRCEASCSLQHKTALGRASLRGHLEVVRVLLAAGADVNAKGLVSLHLLHFRVPTVVRCIKEQRVRCRDCCNRGVLETCSALCA